MKPRKNPLPKPGTPLSCREQQVVQLLIDGLSFADTAARLRISVPTVAMFVARAKARTGAKNLVQLGAWAQEAGFRANV